jgi:ATP-binding cassette, subfamily C, bacterial CydC
LAIVAVAGLVLASSVLVGPAHHQAGQPAPRFVAARADARQTLIETLDGLPELRSFGAEQRAAASAMRQLDRFGHSHQQLTGLAARGQSIGTFLADLTLLAVILTAAGLIGTRGLPAPALVAVCLVAIAVFEPIVGLPGRGHRYGQSASCLHSPDRAVPRQQRNGARGRDPARPNPLLIHVHACRRR